MIRFFIRNPRNLIRKKQIWNHLYSIQNIFDSKNVYPNHKRIKFCNTYIRSEKNPSKKNVIHEGTKKLVHHTFSIFNV